MFERLDTEARIALMQAIEEARELGHAEVGPDHLLLGMLAARRGATAELLTRHGLSFETARTAVRTHHETQTDQAEQAKAQTAEQADDAETPTGSNPEYDQDRDALAAIGIDLDKVREAVRTTFGEDLTERWGRRRSRGERRRHRHGHHHGHDHEDHHEDHHEHHDEGHDEGHRHGRGRRGPRSRRYGDFVPFSRSLRELLHETRHAAFDAASHEAGEHDERGRRARPRLTSALLLAELVRSDDPAAYAVMAGAHDLEALRREAADLVTHKA